MVSAFPDFESAFAATESFCEKGFRIVYLNEAAFVQDHEVEDYVQKYRIGDKCYYHNYRFAKNGRKERSAASSLQTALQLLVIKTRQQAKFIVIVAPKATESTGLPAYCRTVRVST